MANAVITALRLTLEHRTLTHAATCMGRIRGREKHIHKALLDESFKFLAD